MSQTLHPAVTLVLAALARGGAAPRASDGMRILPAAVATAAAAAAALDVQVGQIANSLVFEMTFGDAVSRDAGGEPLLVLTSGAHRVDTGKVAALVGAQRVRRASAELVHAATGQRIGGVAPVGHPTPLRTLVDRALDAHREVWAAGGIPHAVFPTTFAELVAVTGGEPADVA